MKKTFLIAMAVVVTAGFTSCKKDWTCECDDGSSWEIKESTKSFAKTSCEGSTPLTGNITGCTLK